MEKLFDETYTSEDKTQVSRNIWYGYIELYKEATYGKEIILNDDIIDTIVKVIKSDISQDKTPLPTETNWYIYGKTLTKDAIEDTIRPSIMIREKNDQFLVHCNISDQDFALSIDNILLFKSNLEKQLMEK